MDGKDKRLLNDTLSEITGTRHYSSVGEMLSAKFEELGEKDDNGNPVVYENPLKSTDGSSFSVTIPPEGCYRGPVAYGFDPPDAVWTDSRAFEDFAISCFEQNRPDTNNQYYHGLGFSLAEHRDTAGSYKSSPSVIGFAKAIWDSSISSGGAGKVTDALFLLGDRTEDDVRFVLCVSSLDPENDMKAYLEEKPSPYAGFTLKGVERNSLNSVALYYTVDDFTLNPKDIVADRLGGAVMKSIDNQPVHNVDKPFNLIDELEQKGWTYTNYEDGSGRLYTPDGNTVIAWDFATGEIWNHGEWWYAGDGVSRCFNLDKEIWKVIQSDYPALLKEVLEPYRDGLRDCLEWEQKDTYNLLGPDGYRNVHKDNWQCLTLPDVPGTYYRVLTDERDEAGNPLYTLNMDGGHVYISKPSSEKEINDWLIDHDPYYVVLQKEVSDNEKARQSEVKSSRNQHRKKARDDGFSFSR